MDSTTIESSRPINIPIKTANIKKKIQSNSVEYLLTENIFDPAKASPPNEWSIRLSKRITEYSQPKIRITPTGKKNETNFLTVM